MSEKSRKSWLWPSLAWCLGILGMIGIWLSISVWLDSACLWMTVFAILDLTLMLRLTGVSAGWPRFVGILVGTTITVLASLWLIASNAFGLVMGLWPLEAAQQIGPVLVQEFSRLRLHHTDWLWIGISAIAMVSLNINKPR